jgi:hypothetical protein
VADSSANTGDTQNVTYSYFNDGKVKEVIDAVDNKFSQYYDYDFAGRLKRNEFGVVNNSQPYNETLGYDAFNHITSRLTEIWGVERHFTNSYANNRSAGGTHVSNNSSQSSTNTLDVAGNITQNTIYSGSSTNQRKWKFDAAGRMTEWEETLPDVSSLRDWWDVITFDGDGRSAKREKKKRHRINGNTTWVSETEYTIFSSLTGQRITTLDTDGRKLKAYVYMGSSVIGEQNYNYLTNTASFKFKYNTPLTESKEESDILGAITPNQVGRENSTASGAVIPPEEEEAPMPDYGKGGNIFNPESGCQVNYAPVSCDYQHSWLKAQGLPHSQGAGILVKSLVGYIEESKTSRNTVIIDGDEGEPSLETTTTSTAVYEISVINTNHENLNHSTSKLFQKRGKRLEGTIREAVDTCADRLFGVTINSFYIADIETGAMGVVGASKNGEDKVVTTSITTTSKFNKWTGADITGQMAFTPKSEQTLSTGAVLHPLDNYIIKDTERDDPTKYKGDFHPLSQFLGITDLVLQIHELGNSLNNYFGPDRRKESKSTDEDGGEVFETCVREELKTKKRSR